MTLELSAEEQASALDLAREAKAKRTGVELEAVELDAEEIAATLEATLQLKAWTAARRAQIRESADGSFVVSLERAITLVDGKSVRKSVTVKPITLGDVRACSGAPAEKLTGAFADRVVEPVGAYDLLLCQADAAAVSMAVDDALGKYLGNGPS